jgi:hypothetical protein
LVALLLGAAVHRPIAARELYASPQGKPDGKGTRQSPLDLATVLAGQGVAPGDTVWLLPGTYRAPEKDGKRQPFISELKGTEAQPIVLRAARDGRVTLDGWLEVKGQHAWYWGFEIADSTFTTKTKEGVEGHGTSINVFGPGTKFINLDVHDGAMGFGLWAPAKEAEVYGCIIHDFGYGAPDRGHGHAIYTQNETGTKRIVDNVMFRGFGWNVHVYGQQGAVAGYHIEGNISFSAGTRVPGQVADNILVCGYPPADRITLLDNYCYHPGGEKEKGAGWRPCVRLDSYRNVTNGTCVVRGNVIAGARGLQIGRWKSATITDNTIWGPELLATVCPPDEKQFGNYQWDRNTYVLTGQSAPLVIAGARGTGEQYPGVSLEQWRERTGFDRQSKTVEGQQGRPKGCWTYVRPNKYEPGRAHVAVFNWDRQKSVEVDLGRALKPGARYVIHNVQDLYGKPVVAGTSDGKPVRLPLLGSAAAPEFDAFLVVGDP